MKKIYKYPLQIEDQQVLRIPRGSEILSVQTQGGVPCIWAMVDDSLPLDDVVIRMYATGVEIDNADDLRYCGTVQLLGGSFVFHVFLN